MASMFSSTPHFKKSIAIINRLDSTKFPLLLSRIVQKVHLQDEASFTEDEFEKLQRALLLSASEQKDVIEACEFIFHQAAYHSAKPAVLASQLQQLELEEDKVSAVVETWTNSARDVIAKLRQHTLPPAQLDSVNWKLSLQLAQKSHANIKEPTAMLELNVSNSTTDESDHIRMEFNHAQLYAFYNQLETIQSQLDSLS